MTNGSDYGDYDPERPRSTRGSGARPGGDLQQAVDRFEKAVQELVGSATNEFSERATSFLNETTAKLERELGGLRNSDAASRMRARRIARARYRSERVLERSARLTRDAENAKIAGVCAGIANYYGVEHWVVRCIAVTGLLFFSSIVFPAYWIMYFVMDGSKNKGDGQGDRRRNRRDRGSEQDPSWRSGISPSRNLREVQASLQEVELKLRRMESHVTSGQYELQRELHRIETEEPDLGPGSQPRTA
jgi:phage shock protein C